MHVSRQFEAEAVAEWFRHCVIDCKDLPHWTKLCELDARIPANVVSLRCSWGSRVDECSRGLDTRRYSEFYQLKDCKRLRNLQLRVNDSIFDAITDRMVCHDDYEPKDYQKLERMADFKKVPALKSVVLIPHDKGTLADTPEKQQKWTDNLQGLEDFINDRIQNKQLVTDDEPPQAFTSESEDLPASTSFGLFPWRPMRSRRRITSDED